MLRLWDKGVQVKGPSGGGVSEAEPRTFFRRNKCPKQKKWGIRTHLGSKLAKPSEPGETAPLGTWGFGTVVASVESERGKSMIMLECQCRVRSEEVSFTPGSAEVFQG